MVQRMVTLVALLSAVLLAPSMGTASSQDDSVVKFEVMAPVTEPYTGATNAIRGVPGGGLPWEIDEAKGKLGANGRLKVEVEGLVLARRAPVPAELQGTNPVPNFKAIVSCQSISGGAATTTNVETGLVPASTDGDARINTFVALPRPCIAPIIFVTSPTGAWFSATGR
ncbi:MAG: hypothetical protein ACRDPQ_00150 [Nocardioidaceae bacterium]